MKHLFPLLRTTLNELQILIKSLRGISKLSRINFLIPLGVYLIGSYSCIKGTLPHNRGAVDLYIAGNVIGSPDAASFNPVAAYWKNGNYVPLTDGTITADAASVGVSGNDVYAAGTIGNDPFSARAVYWKNGNLNYLTDGVGYSSGNSLAISENDFYVAGSENRGANSVAKYWKNGNAVALTDGSTSAAAFSIFVTGNNAYVAGDENNLAKFWINGIGFPIPPSTASPANGTFISHANSIFVEGKDVYVAGYENNIAKCWKNGVPIPLTSPSGSASSFATSVFVSWNDVYVAGRVEFDNGTPVFNTTAYYWKNGTPIDFTDGNISSIANAIAIDANDIYVGGISSSLATVWINGQEMLLAGQTGALAGKANSIFISKHNSRQEAEKY